MLSDIKKKSTGWIGNLIVAVLALLVCLGGMQYYLTASNKEAVVATIDGHDITKKALDRVYEVNKSSLENNSDPLTLKELSALRRELLEMLIDNQLKLNYANSNNMWVPSIVRDQYLYSQDIFKENNKFSVARYQQIVNAVAGSEATYLAHINNDLLTQQLVVGITNTAFVLPSEVKAVAKLVNEVRNIRYVRLSPSSATSKIDQAELAAYYKDHKSEFTDEAKVKLSYVILDSNAISKKIDVSVEKVSDFYEKNSHLFPYYRAVKYDIYTLSSSNEAANTESAERILVNNPSQANILAEYVRAHDNKVSLLYNQSVTKAYDIDMKNRLSSMQSGDIALYEKDGSLIILNMKEAVSTPYNKLSSKQKEAVTNSYIARNTEINFSKLVEEVTDLAYTEDNLDSIAKRSGSLVKNTNYFTENTSESSITKNTDIRKIAFSEELVVDKLNSSVINLDANKSIVFRVKDYKPAREKTLAEATDEITKILHKQKLADTADKLIKSAKAGDVIEWEYLNNISRVGIINRFGMEIRDAVFDIPVSAANAPSLTKTTLANGDIVVIQVLKNSFPKDFKVSIAEIEPEYANYWARWDLYSFERALRDNSTIKYNNSL